MPMADTSVDVRVGAILFTDLVGFTEYTDAVGDAAALRVLDAQTEILRPLLDERSDARLVKELGDGLMVWFGSAADGLGCAIEFLEAVNEARRSDRFPLAVRLGVHHGEAIARGDDLVGQTVNVASRVADLAGPSELLVSEDALRACGDRRPPARLQPVGPASVRGVQEPIWLHRFGN
jgi:adenylate cyclase